MESNAALKSSYISNGRNLHDEAPRLDGSVGGSGMRLTRRASLILALLFSLGLWAAIWAAVTSLASAIFG